VPDPFEQFFFSDELARGRHQSRKDRKRLASNLDQSTFARQPLFSNLESKGSGDKNRTVRFGDRVWIFVRHRPCSENSQNSNGRKSTTDRKSNLLK
jgi:hypothetical protein